jgi:hypothetical protein
MPRSLSRIHDFGSIKPQELKLLRKSPFFILSTILILTTITTTYSSINLNLTITKHKETYYIGEDVYLYGNLTLDDTPVIDGLIGLQVDDSKDTRVIIRTLPTNITPTQNWLIEILDVVPCDENWNPKDSFPTHTLAYFNVTLKNNDIELRNVIVTICVYDYSKAPIGVSSYEFPMKENTTVNVRLTLPISTKAANGLATVYANAYSAMPREGGKPYSPEKSKTFQITNGITISPNPLKPELIQGNYNTTFRLNMEKPLGTYTVYATTMYQGIPALNITTFNVSVLGDADGDGIVGGKDAGMLGLAWPPQPYNPNCDFNNDGIIDGRDAGIIGLYWGYGTT